MWQKLYEYRHANRLAESQNNVRNVFADRIIGEREAYLCSVEQGRIKIFCDELAKHQNPCDERVFRALLNAATNCDTIFEITNHPHGAAFKAQAENRYYGVAREHEATRSASRS